MNRAGVCLCLALCAGAATASPGLVEALLRAPRETAARTNPYERQPTAVRAGRKLYERECAGCHGAEAHGGSRAPSLKSRTVQDAPPGAIFWLLRNGSLRAGMPSFAHLPEAQRWQVVAYLKSLP